jgi:hypothetical protein
VQKSGQVWVPTPCRSNPWEMPENPDFGWLYVRSSVGTLNGSLTPVSSGIYTYTPSSSLTLKGNSPYFIVVTAGTALADGAYGWSLAGAPPYNPVSGWVEVGGIFTSSNGSSWPLPTDGYFQFAINATAVPEPSTLSLLALGGLFLVWHRRKGKAV